MKKILIIFAFVFIVFQIRAASVLAAQSSASASPSISANLEDKIDSLKIGIASKAAEVKPEVSKNLANKVYYGSIETINSTQITVDTKKGSKNVKINEYTNYRINYPTNAAGSFQSLSKGDYIAALGDVDDKGLLTAKRVVKLKKEETKLPTFLWGQVKSVVNELIKLLDSNNKEISISTSEKTQYESFNLTPQIKDLLTDRPVIYLPDNSTTSATAKFVFLPYMILRSEASNSASPSASPAKHQ